MNFALLLCIGLVQAAQLKTQNEEVNAANTEELTIKMPDAIVEEVEIMEAQELAIKHPQFSLVEGSTNNEKVEESVKNEKIQSTLSRMLESGVLSSDLKPIVHAKVQKVMNFLQSVDHQYKFANGDKKKEITKKAEELIMQNAGTRSFNKELCNKLWAEATEVAATLSSYYCPALIFPPTDTSMSGTPSVKMLQLEPPSRLRSAFLSEHFWNFMLKGGKNEVVDMLDNDACYYWGNSAGTCGKPAVSKSLPYIGFPADSKLSDPTTWHCDTTTCIQPVKAWAKHENFVLTTWGQSGKATEVVVPLDLWR